MEYTYGRIDSCRQHFESAEVAAGLQLSVTGILGWDMAPYIEAIDSQQLSYFIVQSVREPSPGVAQQIRFCFGVYVPNIPALEYGELLLRCHLIGEAVKIFEDLELWDNLIFCYRLLEKKEAAVELIKKRLSEMPNDPRLWWRASQTQKNLEVFRLISELELELPQENLANLLSNLPTIRKTLTDTAKLSTAKEDETETSFLRHCQAFSVPQKDDSTTAPKLSTQTFEFLDEIPLFDEDDTGADED
ncbi:uncharacterized protein LOC115991283 [Quercus lobata]|uniref:uncharacterized protein LOC115991283 n=1 Tax=Quercus lobata TaxID=97700 RepID=UPI0012441BB5|nr:uncharacterized protein LOC115991283 [Quercus lobata]